MMNNIYILILFRFIYIFLISREEERKREKGGVNGVFKKKKGWIFFRGRGKGGRLEKRQLGIKLLNFYREPSRCFQPFQKAELLLLLDFLNLIVCDRLIVDDVCGCGCGDCCCCCCCCFCSFD